MPDPERIVDAEPTKDFFIYMLTRDIGLSRSVLDLVDNSVDGALRQREGGSFEGLFVSLHVSEDRFVIEDNCGGIPLEVAQKYAFRFGRPPEAGTTKHSIGQFGVGMKRALFKLGSEFQIESTSAKSRFVLSESVQKWITRPEWEFEFDEVEQVESSAEGRGTRIAVSKLHDAVSEAFALENFQNELRLDLEEAHQKAIQRGLGISVNGIPLDFDPVDLLLSDQIKPVAREKIFEYPNDDSVTVQIYSGLSESDPQAAGWYIYCNGRLVLGADQTERTGWGAGGQTEVPKFHNRHARFRGYVFFDSDNASLLPWNTTKTGVDADSKIFRAIRLEMISIMRPVVDFLNKLSREIESDEAEKPLNEALEATAPAELAELEKRTVFEAPKPALVVRKGPNTGVISYRKTLDEIKTVQRALGVWTQKEVGERTFDYFYELECRE